MPWWMTDLLVLMVIGAATGHLVMR